MQCIFCMHFASLVRIIKTWNLNRFRYHHKSICKSYSGSKSRGRHNQQWLYVSKYHEMEVFIYVLNVWIPSRMMIVCLNSWRLIFPNCPNLILFSQVDFVFGLRVNFKIIVHHSDDEYALMVMLFIQFPPPFMRYPYGRYNA